MVWQAYIATHIHWWVTVAYLVWAGIALLRMVAKGRPPEAMVQFALMWKLHVRPGRSSQIV